MYAHPVILGEETNDPNWPNAFEAVIRQTISPLGLDSFGSLTICSLARAQEAPRTGPEPGILTEEAFARSTFPNDADDIPAARRCFALSQSKPLKPSDILSTKYSLSPTFGMQRAVSVIGKFGGNNVSGRVRMNAGCC